MADWLRGIAAGQWYEAEQAPFEIIAVDIDNETVLVQHFDGTLADFDFDSWMELGAQPTVPPEDWSGALDVERQDARVDNDIMGPDRYSDPLDYLDSHY